jgi:alginate O-acetyltransferase complex protein AlgI
LEFHSLEYALFLPAVLAVYNLVPTAWRNVVLLAASYLFYASWNAGFLVLVLALTALNYGIGLALGPVDGRRRPRSWLAAAVGLNVGVLAYYKYTGFLLGVASDLLGAFGARVTVPRPTILLPLAISFFTFEFVHYVVDVWRGSPPVRSPLRFALFAAFFPTQIAGPIKRYQDFVPQLESPGRLRLPWLVDGFGRIVRGLFKKTVLADRLAPVVAAAFQDAAAAPAGLPPLDAWLGVLAFAFQVYFDFSGYTDIARGSAALFGFSVPENFRRPYLAASVAEFWRRWHVSLSTWLRDYLFVPLQGLRGHPYRALVITMALGGLWHGANWTFLAWGLWNGLLLSAEWAARSRGWRTGSEASRTASRVAGWAATLAAVCVGFAFFRAASLPRAAAVVGDMLGRSMHAPAVLALDQRVLVLLVATLTLLVEWTLEARERTAAERGPAPLRPWRETLRPVADALVLAAVLVFAYDGRTPFVYFRF